MRIVSFESRRSEEMRSLIERHGGECLSAPSMREVPVQLDDAGAEVVARILAGEIDLMVFLTGVGARALIEIAGAPMVAALRATKVAVRGPKPTAVMKAYGIPIAAAAPEPNTWRELLATLDATFPDLRDRRVAVQEYGIRNDALLDALRARGAEVHPIRVYAWAPPLDPEPLRAAIRAIAAGAVSAVLFTSGNQAHSVVAAARELGLEDALRAGMARTVVASVGPMCSDQLRELGLPVTLEPAHPKMGHLVKACADYIRQNARASSD